MIEKDIEYIVSILKGEDSKELPDWYSVLGFLSSHRIEGLFYNKAKENNVFIPNKIEKILKEVYEKQKRKVCFMRREIKRITKKLNDLDIPYMLLKGSVLSNISEQDNFIYKDGERASNDIDILVRPNGINAVSKILYELGFVQGNYNFDDDAIKEFSRTEILNRRMNRGEVAPFVKKTSNKEFPYLEVDINFSLGNTPSEEIELLNEMIAKAELYKGKVKMKVPNEELFFLHLIMHQYKESCLFFMVDRSRDLDLYKLADIYYLFNLNVLDLKCFNEIAYKYGLNNKVGIVLRQVGEIFNDEKLVCYANRFTRQEPVIIDYENKKRYCWNASIKKRICRLDSKKYLEEIDC